MKKSNESDIQILNNIAKYLTNIRKTFEKNEIKNVNHFVTDEIAQAACTQFITNIYEAKKKLQDKTYNKLIELNKINLSGARNIASHDYNSLDFNIIYYISLRLINTTISDEINNTLDTIEKKESK